MQSPSSSLVLVSALEAGRDPLLGLPGFLLVGGLVSSSTWSCPGVGRLCNSLGICSLLKEESFCKFSDSVCLEMGFGEDVFSLTKSTACTLCILPGEYFSSYVVGDKILAMTSD